MYADAKSNFVKGKIRNRKWRDRDYIDDLLFLEHYVLGEVGSLAGNLKAHGLKDVYEKEFHAIFAELKPREHRQYVEMEKREREKWKKEAEEFKKQERKELKRLKKNWLKAGGKP